MDAHKFLIDFDTKKLGVILGRGEKMTVLVSKIMWSEGLLVKLVWNIAAPDELHSLKMDEDNYINMRID